MERAAGIEPACLTWKDSALPLSYARVVCRETFHIGCPLSKDFLAIFAKKLRQQTSPYAACGRMKSDHSPPKRSINMAFSPYFSAIKAPNALTPKVSVA